MVILVPPFCYSKTRPPSCALGTPFYTVSEGSDLMTYVSDNYTSYSAPSRLRHTLLGSICCMQTFLYLKEVIRHCQSEEHHKENDC